LTSFQKKKVCLRWQFRLLLVLDDSQMQAPSGLCAIEDEIRLAHERLVTLAEAAKDAEDRWTQAAAHAKTAQEVAATADKKSKSVKEIAAEEANAAANAAAQLLEEARTAAEASMAAFTRAVVTLRREHTKLTATISHEEISLSTCRQVVSETLNAVEQALATERRSGICAAALRDEKSTRAAEERATFLAVREAVEGKGATIIRGAQSGLYVVGSTGHPGQFWTDFRRAVWLQAFESNPPMQQPRAMKLGGSPERPNILAPTARQLQPDVRLHQLAKFKAGNCAWLSPRGSRSPHGGPTERAAPAEPIAGVRQGVIIKHVELGDRNLHPRWLKADDEAVYLVEQNSTLTTTLRSKPAWVNEAQLRPRPPMERVGRFGHAPPSARPRWRKNFGAGGEGLNDVADRKAKQQKKELAVVDASLKRQLEDEKTGAPATRRLPPRPSSAPASVSRPAYLWVSPPPTPPPPPHVSPRRAGKPYGQPM
jgi:hypothetical protein